MEKTLNLEIEELLKEIVSQVCDLTPDEIKLNNRVSDFGIDSVDAMDIIVKIEEKLNLNLDPTVLWEYEFFNEFVNYCVTEYKNAKA